MSRDDDREGEAAAAETVVQRSDRLEAEEDGADEAAGTRVLDEGAALPGVRPDAVDGDAETVIAVDDDRTQLVTGRSGDANVPRSDAGSDRAAASPEDDARRPTRVLDPGDAGSGHDLEDATRVVDEADKTAPPTVSSRPRPPARVDPDRGLAPGSVLFGEYEIVNVLGVGGMGEVYRARHRRLDEHRAIKVMHAELSQKKGASEFFYREAKALLAVRHPAVVHCHDLLSDEEGRVYLIMEMIEGIPLSKRMNEGPLSPDEVAILGARISHGLAAAHRKGVIHRDVSPDNIVLPNGRVQEAKLIDFGIAKILQEGEGTIVDGFKGKLSYASPEQLGFFGGKMDGRSDFYSLGLVLAAAALGRPMSMGTTVMEAVDARRGFSNLPDDIPMGLRSAILPLLALDPDDRPQYVDRLFVVPGGLDVLTDSSGFGGGERSHAGRPAARKTAGRAPLYTGIAAVAALTVGGGAWWILGAGEGGRGTAVAESSANGPSASSASERTSAARAGIPSADEGASVPIVARPDAAAAAATTAEESSATPAEARRRTPTAAERIQIIGLLSNARLALEENRLMSPPGDNAYDRYKRILELDPDNEQARNGLRQVAGRYLSLADNLVARGDLDQARSYVGRARQADAGHPGLESAEARIERAGRATN